MPKQSFLIARGLDCERRFRAFTDAEAYARDLVRSKRIDRADIIRTIGRKSDTVASVVYDGRGRLWTDICVFDL